MIPNNSGRSLSSHLILIFFFIITFYLYHGFALSFNLTNIGPENLNVNITVDRDAYISTKGIQVTSDERNAKIYCQVGRAMYIEPLHLWDKASGNLADFDTHFLFNIDSSRHITFADGLTFFLIPPGDSNTTYGVAMGLPIDPTTYQPTSPFVAIEFDSYRNQGVDPENITTHVGIDINSLISNSTEAWEGNIYGGFENEAWVSYNSSSKNLSVIFTDYINDLIHKTVTRDLKHLHLIVDLREYLPEWVKIGFSASTGALFERHIVRSWKFDSSLQISEKTGPDQNSNKFAPEENKRGIKQMLMIVGSITIVISLFISVLVLLGLFFRNRRINAKEEDWFSFQLAMGDNFEKVSGPKKFSYLELSRATSNFDEEQKLGMGGFGAVYRGFLGEFNSYVAVKRISKGSKQGIKEYAAEVKIISRLRHRNLVQLIGWCHEKRELLLVYEYLSNYSLDTHLYKDKSLLTWEKRYRIAKSLASALLYLHEEWEQCVIHRDVKPSNVMLDQDFNAKLGDFGLSRLVDHEKGTQTTVLAGTMGYMAPESVVIGKASKESDVYSFGIVALEIACGRKPIDTSVAQESHVMLVEFVWSLYGEGKLFDATDSNLNTDFDQKEMERLVIVGLWCAHPDYNIRPSIRQALCALNFEATLPILPRKMPVATYNSP